MVTGCGFGESSVLQDLGSGQSRQHAATLATSGLPNYPGAMDSYPRLFRAYILLSSVPSLAYGCSSTFERGPSL